MKNLVFLFLFVFAAFQGFSQTEEYKAKNEGWLVKIEEAHALSEKTGKPIMANFTGSDWCGWCKRLDAAVFNKPEFKKWAAENVVLLELDYPRRKQIPSAIRQQNASLQQAFGVRGFPTVWVFKLEEGEQAGQISIIGLGKTGYKSNVKEFTSDIDRMIARGKENEGATSGQ